MYCGLAVLVCPEDGSGGLKHVPGLALDCSAVAAFVDSFDDDDDDDDRCSATRGAVELGCGVIVAPVSKVPSPMGAVAGPMRPVVITTTIPAPAVPSGAADTEGSPTRCVCSSGVPTSRGMPCAAFAAWHCSPRFSRDVGNCADVLANCGARLHRVSVVPLMCDGEWHVSSSVSLLLGQRWRGVSADRGGCSRSHPLL